MDNANTVDGIITHTGSGFLPARRSPAHIVSLLLLRAGNVEPNPRSSKYLCGACGRGLGCASAQCQGCVRWHHRRCAGLRPADILRLARERESWSCPGCTAHPAPSGAPPPHATDTPTRAAPPPGPPQDQETRQAPRRQRSPDKPHDPRRTIQAPA